MTEIVNEDVQNDVELTAGEMLRNARTTGRRKREIQTVAKQLCIREEFLQALEDGQYNLIPEHVYILGFARNYAMELGLDPDEIVAKIKREMGLVSDCGADADKADENACAIGGGAPKASKAGNAAAGVLGRAGRLAARYWMWGAGAIVLIVLIVGAIIVSIPKNLSDIPAEVVPVSVQPAPVETVTEPAYATPVRERFGTENLGQGSVVLQANQESWVKIEDGRGNTVFSRVLVPGDVYFVPKGDQYRATVGNAGGIDVWVNGVAAPKMGDNHVRKQGISLAPSSLMPNGANGAAAKTAE